MMKDLEIILLTLIGLIGKALFPYEKAHVLNAVWSVLLVLTVALYINSIYQKLRYKEVDPTLVELRRKVLVGAIVVNLVFSFIYPFFTVNSQKSDRQYVNPYSSYSYTYTTAKPTKTPKQRITPTPAPAKTQAPANMDAKLWVSTRYKTSYPMVWGYIEKNADDAQEYVVFYDSVWGNLHKQYGDGIIFGTLTPAQRRLVNFPPLTNRIYLSSKSAKEFHSTPMCYALLKSNPVSTSIVLKNKYDPCSKCVGD